MTDTAIYIIAVGVIGVIVGIIIEMICEKPYIEELERKLEIRREFQNFEIDDYPEEDDEDLFEPF